MPDDPKNALGEFVRFAQTLRGDEKSEAQSLPAPGNARQLCRSGSVLEL
jgi:hypothetical protein